MTREKAKVDRIGCPWLITHFVDENAEFLFVPEYGSVRSCFRGDIPSAL
jgi:hypothetical protein